VHDGDVTIAQIYIYREMLLILGVKYRSGRMCMGVSKKNMQKLCKRKERRQ